MSSGHSKKTYKIDRDFNIKRNTPSTKKILSSPASSQLAKYANIGYYLVTPMIVGVILGLGIDSYFNTRPRFVVLFIILGFVSTIYNLIKLVRDEDQTNATRKH